MATSQTSGNGSFFDRDPDPESQRHRPGQHFDTLTGDTVSQNHDRQQHGGDGVRVWLSRLKGHTKKGLLRQPFLFQCPPLESWTWTQSHGWQDYETLRKDTFSRPGARGLREINFRTLFLDWDADFSLLRGQVMRELNPLHMSDELREVMNSGTPFKLKIGQPKLWGEWDIEMAATLRSLGVEERAGEVDTRYADVTFVQWREAAVTRKRKGKGLPTKHKIKKGDTLRKLSKKYYGNYKDWKRIALANKRLKNVSMNEDLSKLKKKGKPLGSITIPKPGLSDFQKGIKDAINQLPPDA